MPRDIPVGNGTVLVTFDQEYRLRDFYYPHVGKENHTDGHPFRLGLWVEGAFAWVGRDWNPRLEYAHTQLLTDVQAEAASLGAGLHCTDFVAAWDKVMSLDRFDLHASRARAGGSTG